MTIEIVKLYLNAYAEAVTEMGSTPLEFSGPEYEQLIRLIRIYCAGWRHAKNNTESAT